MRTLLVISSMAMDNIFYFSTASPSALTQPQTFIPGRFNDAVLPPSTGSACPVT